MLFLANIFLVIRLMVYRCAYNSWLQTANGAIQTMAWLIVNT